MLSKKGHQRQLFHKQQVQIFPHEFCDVIDFPKQEDMGHIPYKFQPICMKIKYLKAYTILLLYSIEENHANLFKSDMSTQCHSLLYVTRGRRPRNTATTALASPLTFARASYQHFFRVLPDCIIRSLRVTYAKKALNYQVGIKFYIQIY